jgi:hypothetical protein
VYIPKRAFDCILLDDDNAVPDTDILDIAALDDADALEEAGIDCFSDIYY